MKLLIFDYSKKNCNFIWFNWTSYTFCTQKNMYNIQWSVTNWTLATCHLKARILSDSFLSLPHTAKMINPWFYFKCMYFFSYKHISELICFQALQTYSTFSIFSTCFFPPPKYYVISIMLLPVAIVAYHFHCCIIFCHVIMLQNFNNLFFRQWASLAGWIT